MYLLLVVVLFTSSCYSVSSHQYYVSDSCSSVTHTPCGPLSNYARNTSQYNNTIFYFVGTSYTNHFYLENVHNITLQGIGYPFPVITCTGNSISFEGSNNISIINIKIDCPVDIDYSNNVTIYNSIILGKRLSPLQSVDTKIISTIFINSRIFISGMIPYGTILRGKKQYSITLTNISVQYGLYIHISPQSRNNLLKIDQVKAKGGITIYTLAISLYSIHITNTSCYNAGKGLLIRYRRPLIHSISPQLLSHIVIEDSYFFNNTYGIQVQGSVDGYVALSALQPGNILIKSSSISYNTNYGISIEDNPRELSTTIRIVDTELTGNRRNEILNSDNVILSNVNITNTLSTGLNMTGCNDITLNNVIITNALSTGLHLKWSKDITLNNVTITNASSTGLTLKKSVVTIYNSLILRNNTGINGGGIVLSSFSVMQFQPEASLILVNNHARIMGGGIHSIALCPFYYIDLTRPFYKQFTHPPITFKNNTAGIGFTRDIDIDILLRPTIGHALCPLTTSFFLSYNQPCFCNPNDTNVNHSNCSQYIPVQYVSQGENVTFHIILYNYNIYYGTYNIIGGKVDIVTNNVTHTKSFRENCSLIEFMPNHFSGKHKAQLHFHVRAYYDGYEFTYISPPLLEFNLIRNCPIGFSMNNSGVCTCSPSVSGEGVTCDISTQTITHNGLLWIGTYNTSTAFNATQINSNACIIKEQCLLYCSPNPVTFKMNDTDPQCVDNRGQRMCESCRDGYSLLMGSNKCGQCTNKHNYITVAWISLFAVMGILLVIILIALNLTVSVGTLNGLFFYANIVKLYEPVISSEGTLPVLSQLISWINLDFGIETCLYNGMDSYAKQWLQFAFPLYLWIIIFIVIQLCRRYGKISRLMGSHAVPVLSTLIFLSYTKLLCTIVIVLHSREITLHCTNNSLRIVRLWYEDPNLEYAKGKHAGLFVFALLMLLFFVLPYTLFLFCHPVLEKYLSKYKVFKFWSRFKPIIDSYSGPMKDQYRFWPGLLLAARIPVILIFTLLRNESRILLLCMALTVAVIILSLSVILGGVYRKRLHSIIEFWFLFNLCVITALSLAFTDNDEAVLLNICIAIFTLSFILIIVYHIHLQLSRKKYYQSLLKKAKMMILCKKQEEALVATEIEPHKTVDAQMTEIVPTYSKIDISRHRESVVELY